MYNGMTQQGAAAEWSPTASLNACDSSILAELTRLFQLTPPPKKKEKNPILRLSLKQGAKWSPLLVSRLAVVKAHPPSALKTNFRQKNAWRRRSSVGEGKELPLKGWEIVHWWENRQKQGNIKQIPALHPIVVCSRERTQLEPKAWISLTCELLWTI